MDGPMVREDAPASRRIGAVPKAATIDGALLTSAPGLTPLPLRVAPREQRRWRLVSFVACVVLPAIAAAAYLYGYASDQYVAEFRFRLRHARPMAAAEPASGGLGGLAPGGAMLAVAAESQLVVQYMTSRQILDDLRGTIDIDAIYGGAPADWLARLDRNAPLETKLRYWNRVVDPFYDAGDATVTVKARAFRRDDAQRVAGAVLQQTERLVNRLSDRAHADAVTYAMTELRAGEERLRRAEIALAAFRNAHRVLFPALQANASSTVDAGLQTQIAQARSNYEALRAQGVTAGTPQVAIIQKRIGALEGELARVRAELADDSAGVTQSAEAGTPLASVLSDYAALDVEERIAERAYEASSLALQRANDEARQQQIYLDAYVRPAEPQKSLYPVRWRMTLEMALGCFAAWCIATLMTLAIRDHIE